MKTNPNVEPSVASRTGSLTKALDQSRHVNELIRQCAEELASANTLLKHELACNAAPRALEIALGKQAAIEGTLRDASTRLADINLALEHEIRGRIMVDHQLAAAVEQREGARHAAFHDALTGLPNRALFYDRLEHALVQAKRHGGAIAVMFVDLDKFKVVNDTYGHEAGDVVLQTAARRLRENTRGADTVSRHGGDEFLYLLTEARDETTIAMIAQKIITAIQAPCSVKVRDLEITPSIGASIGISIFPKDGATADALIDSADGAMYRAKESKTGFAFDRRSRARPAFAGVQMPA
ncbi:MAG: GGDEF domain-containing protein [Betaproteobacteria bacterium]